MSDKSFDVEYLEVGDSYEGGPIEQSYFISAILAAGGEVEIDGDKVTILQLPKNEKNKAKAPVHFEPIIEKTPEPAVPEVPAVEAPKPTPKPAPKPRSANAPTPAPAKEEG